MYVNMYVCIYVPVRIYDCLCSIAYVYEHCILSFVCTHVPGVSLCPFARSRSLSLSAEFVSCFAVSTILSCICVSANPDVRNQEW